MTTTATTTTATPSRPTRRLARVAAATVAAATLAAAGASSASAYTIIQNRVPVAPTIYQSVGTHLNIGTPHAPQWVRRVTQSGPVVQRTAPGGTEHISVTYSVYRWDGSSWAWQKNYTGSALIPATQVSAKLPPLRHDSFSAGYYRVTESITYTSPIGAVIGSYSLDMSEARDYKCNTSYSCSVGAGYIYLS